MPDTQKKDNPFLKAKPEDTARSEGAEAAAKAVEDAVAAIEKPKRKRASKKQTLDQAAAEIEIESLCQGIRDGKLDDQMGLILAAWDERRQALKDKVREQVKIVFGDDYDVAAQRSQHVHSPAHTGDRHPNEVDLDDPDALPDGYGSPSIMDTGGAVTAADPMAMTSGESDIVTTGAVIG